MKKLSGLKQNGDPNAAWRKFKERLDSYDQVSTEYWTPENLLGHILKRYSSHYGFEYSLSYSGAPTKCKEIYCVKRLVAHMGAKEDFAVLKNYIDWVFDEIIKKDSSIVVNSLAFFFTINLIQRFKIFTIAKSSKPIDRSTALPEEYLIPGFEVSTYGDLAFAKIAADGDPESEYVKLFQALQSKNFDMDQLEYLGE